MSRSDSKMNGAKRLALGAVARAAALVLVLGLAGAALAQGPGIGYEQGLFCVNVYAPHVVCTANDVRLEELRVVQLINGCTEAPVGEMTAIFEGLVVAQAAGPSPDRYDIGFFIALDGGDAVDAAGQCFHGYLEPPLVPAPIYGDQNADGIPDVYNMDPVFAGWKDAQVGIVPPNTCGDIETGTQIIAEFPVELTIPCDDNDGDGFVDIGACTSWENNQNSACTTLQEAFPGTPSKCSCNLINLPNQVTAVDLASFTAAPQSNGVLLTWETGSELDNLGFNVYRAGSMEGARTQLNQVLIASQNPGSAMGATYTFVDEAAAAGTRYYYWLEDLAVKGMAERYGPVTAKAASTKSLPGRPRPAPFRFRNPR